MHAADRTLGRIVASARRHAAGRRLVTIVTSDHGELLGERGLLGHEFNVSHPALHVPLVVHGTGDSPAEIDVPVRLADVFATVVRLAGLEPPAGTEGRALPVAPASDPDSGPEPRSFFAAYSDVFQVEPDDWTGVVEFVDKDRPRRACGPDDKVFGAMGSLTRHPLKYHWFERYPPELYDLGWDPDERFDQMRNRPEEARRMAEGIAPFLTRAGLAPDGDEEGPVERLDEEAVEALRALGYAE